MQQKLSRKAIKIAIDGPAGSGELFSSLLFQSNKQIIQKKKGNQHQQERWQKQ